MILRQLFNHHYRECVKGNLRCSSLCLGCNWLFQVVRRCFLFIFFCFVSALALWLTALLMVFFLKPPPLKPDTSPVDVLLLFVFLPTRVRWFPRTFPPPPFPKASPLEIGLPFLCCEGFPAHVPNPFRHRAFHPRLSGSFVLSPG